MLGDYFLSLDSSAGGFVVTVSGPGKAYHTETTLEAADAYAHAVLYVSRWHAIRNELASAPLQRRSRLERSSGEQADQASGVGADQHRRCVWECLAAAPGESQQSHEPTYDGAEQKRQPQQRPGCGSSGCSEQGANRTSPKPNPPREISHTIR